jgi:hypothetical protein
MVSLLWHSWERDGGACLLLAAFIAGFFYSAGAGRHLLLLPMVLM